MEWHHANLPKKKKFKSEPSAGKVMATVFFIQKGFCLLTSCHKDPPVTTRIVIVQKHTLHML
jgi:hypothetical protein